MENAGKQKIQNQLRQFLKEYRTVNGLSAEQAADNLQVEIATYRTLEGRKPSNRVISVLEYLEKIASLNKMSLCSFINLLERSQRTESGSNQTKRSLYSWERELLDKFDKVGIPLRNRFLKSFTDKSGEEIKELLVCLTQIAAMTKSKRSALFALVKEMVADA